jgi:hypothetical protein
MSKSTNHSPANPAAGREAEFQAALEAYVASYRAETRRRTAPKIAPASPVIEWLAPLWPRRSGALSLRRMA